jgi:methionine aminopeptidase
MNVVTKYKEAAKIANSALEAVLAACDAGASVVRLHASSLARRCVRVLRLYVP